MTEQLYFTLDNATFDNQDYVEHLIKVFNKWQYVQYIEHNSNNTNNILYSNSSIFISQFPNYRLEKLAKIDRVLDNEPLDNINDSGILNKDRQSNRKSILAPPLNVNSSNLTPENTSTTLEVNTYAVDNIVPCTSKENVHYEELYSLLSLSDTELLGTQSFDIELQNIKTDAYVTIYMQALTFCSMQNFNMVQYQSFLQLIRFFLNSLKQLKVSTCNDASDDDFKNYCIIHIFDTLYLLTQPKKIIIEESIHRVIGDTITGVSVSENKVNKDLKKRKTIVSNEIVTKRNKECITPSVFIKDEFDAIVLYIEEYLFKQWRLYYHLINYDNNYKNNNITLPIYTSDSLYHEMNDALPIHLFEIKQHANMLFNNYSELTTTLIDEWSVQWHNIYQQYLIEDNIVNEKVKEIDQMLIISNNKSYKATKSIIEKASIFQKYKPTNTTAENKGISHWFEVLDKKISNISNIIKLK